VPKAWQEGGEESDRGLWTRLSEVIACCGGDYLAPGAEEKTRHSLSFIQARWRRSTRAACKFAVTRLEGGAYVWRISQQGP